MTDHDTSWATSPEIPHHHWLHRLIFPHAGETYIWDRYQPRTKQTKTPTIYPAGSVLKRIRQALGFCFWCNHHATTDVVFNAYDDNGVIIGTAPYKLCDDHAAEAFDAIASAPHQGTATMTSGTEISWDSPGRS